MNVSSGSFSASRFPGVSVVAALLALWFLPAAQAAPAVSATNATGFEAAEAGRSFMTIDGVWNGSQEVTATTGDTFVVTWTNSGDATAFDFAPSVTLPDGFHYVAGTATLNGAAVTATQTGSTLVFNLGGFDLAAGASAIIRYGVYADASVPDGTRQLVHRHTYALTDGGALLTPAPAAGPQQNIVVQAGASTLSITPSQQTRAVGQTATFTVTITNTGLGGLFDVVLDQSAIAPASDTLRLLTIAQTSPAGRPAAVSGTGGSILTLGYLAPGESFSATVTAEVLACGDIVNTAATDDRAHRTAASGKASVQLDLRQPLVGYSAPSVTLDYNVPVTVTIPVANTGLGDARNFTLHTTLPGLGVTVSSVAAGWTYSATTGVFTLNDNGGTVANGATATLAFDLEATDICNDSGAGSVFYEARYTNGCDDPYTIPQAIGSIAAAADAPSLTLSKTVSASRIATGEPGSWTLTLSATHFTNIATESITVTDTVSPLVTILNPGSLPAGVTWNGTTRTLAWTVARNTLSAPQSVEIDFAVSDDPCDAGQIVGNTAGVTAVTTRGCALAASASAGFLITNNPGRYANQYFNVTGTPAGGIYETGAPTADSTRDAGEGEFIPFEANYEFGAAYPGIWTGTTYEDGFGGVAGMTLVPGSLTIRRDGGAPVPVPASAVTTLSPGFRIDLGFLAQAGWFGSDPVAGHRITLDYQVTAPDAALAGAATRAVTQLTTLDLELGDTGTPDGCGVTTQTKFTQGAFYTIGRAVAAITLSMAPQIDVCKEEALTITLDNVDAHQTENLLVTLFTGTAFTYDPAQTPVYGDVFASGYAIAHNANGGVDPSFTITRTGHAGGTGPLTGAGTITVRVVRKVTGTTATTGLNAEVRYDSWQTEAAAARVYSTATAWAPQLVRTATLALTSTPGTLPVTGSTVTFVNYVTNTNAGTAWGAKLDIDLPAGLEMDAAATLATNNANAGFPVAVGGQQLAWALGDILPGETRVITVVATVAATGQCEIAPNPTGIRASWGCDGSAFTETARAQPVFVFPRGQMQVVHDSSGSLARLCDLGEVIIIVRNTGATAIRDAIVREILPSAQGLSLEPGSVQYSVNGGGWTSAADPSVSGDTHTWTAAQIPALAKLVPVGAEIDGVTTHTVRIRFALRATTALAGTSPVLNASATATVACGDLVDSPAQPFTIPVDQPRIVVAKTGRNVTAGETGFVETVYGGQGDEIEWRIEIKNTNTRDEAAHFIRLSDALSGSGGTALITGPGHTGGTDLAPGQVIAIPDLAPGASAEYLITEILGANCVTADPATSVSWGCSAPAAGQHNAVTAPGAPTDSARIVMQPSIAGAAEIAQTITYLPGGRARIDVEILNRGGNAFDLVVTNTFPNSQMVLDETVAPTFGNHVTTYYPTRDSVITGVTYDSTTDTVAPKFTFRNGGSAKPMLRYGDKVTLTYYVRSTVFDTDFADAFPELATEDTPNGRDPAPPAPGTNTVRVDYRNSCAGSGFSSVGATIDLRSPNLSVTGVGPNGGNTVITGTDPQTYTFTITNVGDADSVADFITIDFPVLGSGWTVQSITFSTTGTAGSGGNSASQAGGVWTLTPGQLGTLAAGQSITVSATLAYSGTPGPLSLVLRVRGEARGQDPGVSAPGNYSYDQRGQRIVGVELAKTLLDSTTEPDSAGATVFVGEEATFRLRARFFGAEADITGVTLRDTPADSSGGGLAHTGLAFVRSAATTDNKVATTLAAPVPVAAPASVAASRVNHTAASISQADVLAGDAVIENDLTVRVLNLAANTDGKTLRNNLGLEFTYLGQRFRSNDSDDGFSASGSPASSANLHRQSDLTVRRPQLAVEKTVRNVTLSGAFAATAGGQAGDVIEYRLVVTNPAAAGAPLYNLVVTDTVPAPFSLDAGTVGADTTGGGTVDVASTGGVTGGPGGTLALDETNTPVPDAGRNLARLDPGRSVTILYRGTLEATVNPSQTLTNNASVTGYSVPVDAGTLAALHQTAPAGVADTATGALRLAADGVADIRIHAIDQQKQITAATYHTAPFDPVFIGERITYQVSLTLPLGTVPDLTVVDTLPAGFALAPGSPPVVAIGGDISDAGNIPAVSIAGTGDPSPQTLTWSFGQRVAGGADRTITIDYTVDVLDVPANTAAASPARINNATYNFTGLPGDVTNFNKVGVTLAEPVLALAKTRLLPAGENLVRPGDTVKFRLTVANTGNAPAWNIALRDVIPAGMRAAAPVLDAATIDGVALAPPNPALAWDAGSGDWTLALDDTAPLPAGKALVVEYTVTVDTDNTLKGKTLTNSATVGAFYSKPSADTHARRIYPAVGPSTQDVVVGLEIRGSVYNDTEPNGHKDAQEDWTGGPTVCVNLVPLSGPAPAGAVYRTATVNSGNGEYLLPLVPPGTYRIVLTTTAAATGAQAPAAWMFRTPPDGVRPVAVTAADLLGEDFGLYQGRAVSGIVFRDTGDGAGIANNGRRDGAESGLGGVTVRLLDAGGAELGSTATDGSGAFSLYIPDHVATGATLRVVQSAVSAHIATGGHPSAAYDRADRTITVTTNGAAIGGLEFGNVPENVLLTDGAQTILPGGTAFYRHTFIAGTGGTVTFTLSSAASPAIPWTQVVLADPSGNGTPGAVIEGAAIPVTAGQEYHLVVRHNAPDGAPWGAVNPVTLTATFAFAGSSGLPDAALTRQDVTTVGATASAGLQLVKTVDRSTALPGQELVYTIAWTNTGAGPLTDLFIADSTPAYTVFVSAAAITPLPAGLTLDRIDAPAADATGAIRWVFTGSLAPGAEGAVTFKVRVED